MLELPLDKIKVQVCCIPFRKNAELGIRYFFLYSLFAIPLLQCIYSLSLLRYFSEFCNTLPYSLSLPVPVLPMTSVMGFILVNFLNFMQCCIDLNPDSFPHFSAIRNQIRIRINKDTGSGSGTDADPQQNLRFFQFVKMVP
jgi:hypothetical protein